MRNHVIGDNTDLPVLGDGYHIVAGMHFTTFEWAFSTMCRTLELTELVRFLEKPGDWHNNEYHNLEHCKGVALLVYQMVMSRHDSCTFHYREMRNLIAAALLHDYNHTGDDVPDSFNITRAVEALAGCPEPWPDVNDIQYIYTLIRVTEFPFVHTPMTQAQRFLRDADLLWLSTRPDPIPVLFGLYAEVSRKAANKDLTLKDFLASNVAFVDSCELFTKAGKAFYAACRPNVVAAIQSYMVENNLV